MNAKDEENEHFFKKLIVTFKIEAVERVQNISASLLSLENTTKEDEIKNLIELIYREYHSLKSAASSVNFNVIENICQRLESIFALLKKDRVKPNIDEFDVLHKVNDVMVNLIENSNNTELDTSSIKPEILAMLEILEKAQPPEKAKTTKTHKINTTNASTSHTEDTVRISVSKLDALLVQAEELLSTKINFERRIADFIGLKSEVLKIKLEWEKLFLLRSMLKKSEKNINESIILNENFFLKLSQKMTEITNKLDLNLYNFNLGASNLLENTKKLLLLPFSTILTVLPKIVRDLARAQEKEIQLIIFGSEIEIDKRILEETKESLLHIIRNAIDHGIELPEERKKQNKNEVATLNIDIHHMTGNTIQIQIKDDGKGIDIEAVKKSAINLGLITEEVAKTLSQTEVISLIYHSGVSSSPALTNLSGRGLGMSIIREKIEKAGGMISVISQLGKGTTVTIQLPLTMATFKGIVISVSNRNFILPLANIERIIRINPSEIKSVANKNVIAYDNQTIPLFWLAHILALPTLTIKKLDLQPLVVLILSSNDQKVSFVIDEALNEQEVLIKHFSKPILRIRNISAAAILDTGQPIPILNALDLLQTEHTFNDISDSVNFHNEAMAKKVLLAEDSITTRTLLKNILEIGGFEVITAIDGLDAWEKMQSTDFNLVVSDIEMPRLNGFELTEKIRNDKKFSDLKIILVTSKKDPSDRERGIDVGANAYLLKDTFDSKELLEIAHRLSI